MDTATDGDACQDDSRPPGVDAGLDRATSRAQQAMNASPRKAKRLLKAARRGLKRVAMKVKKAAGRNQPPLSQVRARAAGGHR